MEKLHLIAGLAESVAEEIQSHRAWQLTLEGVITETHQLVVQFPHDFPPCKVKVVIAWPDGMDLSEVSVDQLKVTVQMPDTEAAGSGPRSVPLTRNRLMNIVAVVEE